MESSGKLQPAINSLQIVSSNQESLSTNQLFQRITALIKAQLQFFADRREEYTSKKKLRVTERLHELQNAIKFQEFQDTQFYEYWKLFNQTFSSNSTHEALSQLLQKCEENKTMQFTAYSGLAYPTGKNPPIANVIEKKYCNAKEKIAFPIFNDNTKNHQPVLPIEDLSEATRLGDLLLTYEDFLQVELTDQKWCVYDFKSDDEDICENNTNLKFSQQLLALIPESDRIFLLKYIKPYMFTPIGFNLYMVYGEKTAQKVFKIERKAVVCTFFVPTANLKIEEDHAYLSIFQDHTIVEDKSILSSLIFSRRVNVVFSTDIATEKSKIDRFSHLLNHYIGTLKDKQSSHVSQEKIHQSANLVEDRKKFSKVNTNGGARRRRNRKKNFSVSPMQKSLGNLPKLTFPIPKQYYSIALTIIGTQANKITWEDASSCAARLNFKVKLIGGSSYEFTYGDHLTFLDSKLIIPKLKQFFEQDTVETSRTNRKQQGENQKQFLSYLLLKRFKRMFEQVGINKTSLKSIDK